jgi:hypothetical protein
MSYKTILKLLNKDFSRKFKFWEAIINLYLILKILKELDLSNKNLRILINWVTNLKLKLMVPHMGLLVMSRLHLLMIIRFIIMTLSLINITRMTLRHVNITW